MMMLPLIVTVHCNDDVDVQTLGVIGYSLLPLIVTVHCNDDVDVQTLGVIGYSLLPLIVTGFLLSLFGSIPYLDLLIKV